MKTYAISLLIESKIYHGQIKWMEEMTIGSGKKNSLFVPGLSDVQIHVFNNYNGLYFNVKHPYNLSKKELTPGKIIVIDKKKQIGIVAMEYTGVASESITLPYNGTIRIGRSKENQVVLTSRFVSKTHLMVRLESGVARFQDLDSTNGVYLNGEESQGGKLKTGDILSIVGFQILYENNHLYFINVGDKLTISEKTTDNTDKVFSVNAASDKKKDKMMPVFHRSPRMMSMLPDKEITLATPPSKGHKFEKSGGIIASLLGTGSMFAASMAMGAASPAYMAARAAMLVSPIASAGTHKSADKKRKKQLEKYEEKRRIKYGEYIREEKARIEAVANDQREIISSENPAPEKCLAMINDLNRRLFERTMSDRDFLDVRLGMGYEKLCVPVKTFAGSSEFYMDHDDVRDLVEELIEETRIVDYVPFRLQMNRFYTIGVVGERSKMIAMIHNLIISLTSTHFYRDVKIIGVFDENEKDEWESLRWLPHVWDDNKDSRFLAFGSEDKQILCEKVNGILEYRRRMARESNYGTPNDPVPHYIFLAGSRNLMKDEVILKNLLSNEEELGITTLFLFDEINSIPHGCRYIVNLSEECIAYEAEKYNIRTYFTMDPPVQMSAFDQFARRMSAIRVEGLTESGGIPETITFLQGYNVGNVDDLDIQTRWETNKPYDNMSVPIGQIAGGKTFSLDISEKEHGPHGLVAGTTGSGKSELLITWILSMAVNYHPHDVAFVLIDYKGGGMANVLEKLPHVVGKITNIGSNINRSLISLESETKKRMKLFDYYSDVTGVAIKDISQYQRLYRAGRIDQPLPSLILVADEFAELKKNEPEFMSGLISVARVGRSLGIHMVLATQKPSGVVDDQIWANSQFRLCLKVQSAADSRDMLKTPDAAGINRPGRLYFQTGEIYELAQSYWSGAPYITEKTVEIQASNQLKIVSMAGDRFSPIKKKKRKSQVDEVSAVIQSIEETARRMGIQPLDGPWLPELPEYVTLRTIIGQTGYYQGMWRNAYAWPEVPIGLYDNPSGQSQGVELLNFVESGHLGIYGAPSTGKTTLMKTIMLSAALNNTPAEVQMYVLDCGGWTTSEFAAMPHMGGIALDCETEKVQKLEQVFWEELEYRKNLLLKHHVSSLEAYRESYGKVGDQKVPVILFFIDNFPAVFEMYPDMENLFITLSGQGAAYGIYLIYTSNSPTGIRFKVMQNIKNAIAFEMTDRGDYPTLVGKLEGIYPSKIQGRALRKGKPPMEVQIAMYMDGETDAIRSRKLQELFEDMNRHWNGPWPRSIPVMPDTIRGEEIAKAYKVKNHIPVGISFESIKPCYVNLENRYNLVITGGQASGKSSLLIDIFSMINSRESHDHCYVYDSRSESLSSLKSMAEEYVTDEDPDGIRESVLRIVESLNNRVRQKKKIMKENPSDFNEEAYMNSLGQILIFIDDLKEFVDKVDDETRDSMVRIAHLAQGLGVMIFAACRSEDLLGYATIESLTVQLLKNQQGIALSDNALTYTMFKENLSYAEKTVNLQEREGYYFNDGVCVKFKRRDL